MPLCFDTSALLPFYRREPRSDAVEELLRSQTEPVLLADLARLEVASVVARWVRTKDIREHHAVALERAFDQDLAAGRYAVRELRTDHVDLARRWSRSPTTALRTLDALHLATAAVEGATLVTFDGGLLAAAEAVGVATLRP